MIKVKIKKNNNLIDTITISGHAKYSTYGKDIVCSSVSSIVTATINAILRLEENSISYIDNNDLTIKILNHNKIVDTLIDNMLSLLCELEKDYKKYIKIEN